MSDTRIVGVRVGKKGLRILGESGVSAFLPYEAWPRLAQGTYTQRRNWRLIADGEGIHWPELDEDISAAIFNPERTVKGS